MSAATLSIVIPTYNRKPILKMALEAYGRQTARDSILEILVVDDGSTDGTVDLVHECAQSSPVPIRCLHQENKGQGAARNHGIREARGELLLSVDDDIIPAPTMVEEHTAWHRRHPEPNFAVLGYVPWSPDVHPTPLMRWSIVAGPQFSYGIMPLRTRLSFEHCYFGNTSLKLSFLRENGSFDEEFRGYGCEDWDLGFRLQQKGLVMMYNPRAIGYHHKRMTFADFCGLRQKMAASYGLFYTKDAGRAMLESQRRRRATRQYRFQRRLIECLVPVLTPLKPLLDSRIPLPGSVYHAFYAYYGVLSSARHSSRSKHRFPHVRSTKRRVLARH